MRMKMFEPTKEIRIQVNRICVHNSLLVLELRLTPRYRGGYPESCGVHRVAGPNPCKAG